MLPHAIAAKEAHTLLEGIEDLPSVQWAIVEKALTGRNGQPVKALVALALIAHGITQPGMADPKFNKLRRTAKACIQEALPLVMTTFARLSVEDPPEPGADPHFDVREFMRDLDAELLRLECAGQLYKHMTHTNEAWRTLRVLYRGENERGQVECFLYEQRDAHGMLIKLGGEWSHLLGTRDELLASMPETYFEDAALTVLA